MTFLHGDLFTLELPDFNYDIVVKSLVLEHIEDLKKFFLKVSTHSRTGGDLHISEIHPARTQGGIFARFKNPGSDEVLANNPKWQKHLGKPMMRIWHFSKS